MDCPLSPLSPSRLNSRPSHLQSLASPLSKSPMGDAEDLDNLYYDENTIPSKQTRNSPVFDIHEDHHHDQSGFQNPPSSPFQDSINIEYTDRPDEGPAALFDADESCHIEPTHNPYEDYTEHDLDMNEQENVSQDQPADAVETGDNHEDKQIVEPESSSRQSLATVVEENTHEHMSIVRHQNEGDSSICDSVHGDNSVGDHTSLSTFSAVPNADMTLFSKLRNDSPLTFTPNVRDQMSQVTPRSAKRALNKQEPGMSSSETESSSFPRSPVRKYMRVEDDANLLDFTDQMDVPTNCALEGQKSPYRARRTSPRKPGENFRSPNKFSLLDFDIPPPATPRSIPSITPRELESLKSSFLSQISSLKATLNGKDAEVASLKDSVSDAERRVGEALEQVRNETAKREALESEQVEWERRSQEMKDVLRTVKAEMADGERERESLAQRAEEAERAREQMEGKLVELESQLSAARSNNGTGTQGSAQPTNCNTRNSDETAREVQDAVERVARELHALYKGKHETKVAALKKSYEARWEKRVKEGENKLRDALEKIKHLQSELNGAKSRFADEETAPGDATMLRENEGLEAEKRVLEARIKGLEQEMISLKKDSEALRSELKAERAEKGELVAVVDEWLQMQQDSQPAPEPAEKPSTPPCEELNEEERSEKMPISQPTPAASSSSSSSSIGLKSSTSSRPRQLPQSHTPRIPRFGAPSGTKVAPSGIAMAKTPGRSGIMSSIERMGRGGN
ncbi:hypothetical protein H112_05480 [Trichophyton rubrum D6]|uniref:Uncharacterized protein n=3 Tax=Trichophyton rubrum TaxID=5551 RepID=A0A178EPV8_TRIRU|nr:uncharacterized protein TERG_03217 [Trichophyton rubrum CBS 118892]EZF17201.1 hypothetical protein H100_05497 [Trichophyton rubrum MR850]EZF40610.1 hypothetical protein H102_05463 [Trichophyton rubrum CBS 100081]EZF51279.1 hypothetical protein H103_05490 [Trichophyton rubrum CBS 288.86]EZF61804.1 hypothetical protein H104_05479 [Trichophyton rubrum CBS 289.86]EZF83170.1 hypothetical protein H110_05486 [Trichophyton rubrum MR1448]EZF93879.1 hypothetical protein H113_05534 [Trichophyton rubr